MFNVLYNVCQTIVEAGLKRSTALNGVTFVLHVDDIVIVVKKLTLLDLSSVPLLDEIIPNLNDLVIVVNVSLGKSVEIGL